MTQIINQATHIMLLSSVSFSCSVFPFCICSSAEQLRDKETLEKQQ